MPNNDEVVIISASLSSQGPTGPRGFRGKPAFIQFSIVDGDLWVDEVYDDYSYQLVDGNLIITWNEQRE